MRLSEPKSIAEVIRERNNESTAKRIWNWRKLILYKCKYNNVVRKFLSFRVAFNHLKYASTYKQCQSNLLREEFRQKKSAL